MRPLSRNFRARTAWAVCASFFSCAAVVYAQTVNPINMSMMRNHAPEYTAGQEIEIQVTMTASSGAETINAVGLRESIPNGWTYLGMGGATGQPPAVQPSPGTTQLLEFAWIEIPVLPYSFTYTIGVPENDPGGSQVIHGQFEYRLDGPALFGPPMVTTLNGNDRQPPVVRLNGGATVTIRVGEGWSDPGATARDNADGDISASIQITGSVDANTPGTYAVTYTATDSSGNSNSATRTVTVVAADDPGTDTPDGGVDPDTGGPIVGTPGGNYGGGISPGGQRNATNRKPAKPAGSAANARQKQAAAGTAATVPGGGRQLLPGVEGAEVDPQTGIIITKNGAGDAPGAPGTGTPEATGGTTSGSASRPAGAAAPVADGDTGALSDAWPENPEASELAAVSPVATDTTLDSAPAGGALATPAASGLPVLIVGAVGVALIAAIFFVSRSMVYGGQRRRKPAKSGE